MGQLRHCFESVNLRCVCDWVRVQFVSVNESCIKLASVFQCGAISVELEPDRRHSGSSKLHCGQYVPYGSESDEQLHTGKCLYVGGRAWS
jgi:hypothetical protein